MGPSAGSRRAAVHARDAPALHPRLIKMSRSRQFAEPEIVAGNAGVIRRQIRGSSCRARELANDS